MSAQEGKPANYILSSPPDKSTRKKTSSWKSYSEEDPSNLENDGHHSRSRKGGSALDTEKSHSKSNNKSAHHKSKKHPSLSENPSKSQLPSKSSGSHSSSLSPQRRKRAPSETLVNYLQDPTHTNPGYSATYTQGLINAYGFPEEPAAQQDLESAIVNEALARVQGSVSQYGGEVEYE